MPIRLRWHLQAQQTPFERLLISQELGIHTKLQQIACTPYSNGLTPTTRSPWSQNAKQKRLPKKNQEISQFCFWHTTLQLELLVFIFVRSLRETHFALYVYCLTKLTPWFFSFDHTNYTRWVPVHIRDMVNVSTTKQEAVMEFMNGNFNVRKTNRVFSMALDGCWKRWETHPLRRLLIS